MKGIKETQVLGRNRSDAGFSIYQITLFFFIAAMIIVSASLFNNYVINDDNKELGPDDLLLIDLDVSLQWDASSDPSYMDQLAANIVACNKTLYNVSAKFTLDDNVTYEGPSGGTSNESSYDGISTVIWNYPMLMKNESINITFYISIADNLTDGHILTNYLVVTADDAEPGFANVSLKIGEDPTEPPDPEEPPEDDGNESEVRGFGFWKHQFKAHSTGKGHAQINLSELELDLAEIANKTGYFLGTGFVYDIDSLFDWMNNKTKNNKSAKAEKFVFCTWLNNAHGYIDNNTVLDTGAIFNHTGIIPVFNTVGGFLKWAENVLLDPTSSGKLLEDVKDIAEGINEGYFIL